MARKKPTAFRIDSKKQQQLFYLLIGLGLLAFVYAAIFQDSFDLRSRAGTPLNIHKTWTFDSNAEGWTSDVGSIEVQNGILSLSLGSGMSQAMLYESDVLLPEDVTGRVLKVRIGGTVTTTILGLSDNSPMAGVNEAASELAQRLTGKDRAPGQQKKNTPTPTVGDVAPTPVLCVELSDECLSDNELCPKLEENQTFCPPKIYMAQIQGIVTMPDGGMTPYQAFEALPLDGDLYDMYVPLPDGAMSIAGLYIQAFDPVYKSLGIVPSGGVRIILDSASLATQEAIGNTPNPTEIPEPTPDDEEPTTTPVSSDGCQRTGCSGQICSDESVVSTCEWNPAYACYEHAVCERQSDGACGWTLTQEYDQCLQDVSDVPFGCFYDEVQCVTEPCEPVLVCP